MNRLRHFQRDRIQTINHAALIGFAALSRRNPQRVFLLADGHFIRALAYRLAQHLFSSMNLERTGKQ